MIDPNVYMCDLSKRIIIRILIFDGLVELAWVLLRWTDNKRKGKTISDFWSYVWVMILYGEINGRVPLADIEAGWRKGTWFEQTRGKRGWQGPAYIDTEFGTIYMGRKVLDAYWPVDRNSATEMKGTK